MRKKIDIVLVVDCSGSLKPQKAIIEKALNEMVRAIKTNPDLYGCEISFSLVPFSEDVIWDKYFAFKPIKDIKSTIDLGEFENVTNPGDAIKNITVKALANYEAWKAAGDLCFHPLIFFFTDGYPYHPDDAKKKEYIASYKAAASFVKEQEGRKKLLLVGGAFGPNADIANMNLLTSHPERILKISASNIDKLERFFSEIIPMTTVTTLTKSTDQLEGFFKAFNEEE